MPAKQPLGKEKPTDDSHPFGQLWLDSCYQETLLPNGPWQSVSEELTTRLAERIQRQLDMPERRQMLFELLGQQFVQKYFPGEQFLPAIIAPPQMTSETRKKLQIDAQNWLQNALNKIALETGSTRSLQAEQTGVPQSKEVSEYLRHTGFIFAKGMNRQMFLQEKEIEKQWEDVRWQKEQAKIAREDARERARLRQEYERLRGVSSGLRSILRTMVPPSTAGSSVSAVTSNVKGAEHGLEDDPPAIWGMQSNSLGRSVIHILRRDPRRFGEVVGKLHARQLPGSLRTYIWMDVLLRQERQKLSTPNIEKIVRERFGKAVSRGVGELRIKRATHSPISGLIDNAVIEIYGKTPAMKIFVSEEPHVKESAKALNVLYVYDRSYEPYLVYWLFPLQLAFQDTAGQSEHVYELAMYLDLLNKSCFPKWPEIFAVAEKSMKRLKEVDPELHDHLKKVAQIEPNVNPKEFMVQLIHEEKSQAESILRSDFGSKMSVTESRSLALLADPLVFIRRWVGEGFVGVLDTQAAIFVWDQCFMQKWSPRVLEDVCLALLLLLRYLFMDTVDYKGMRKVFLNEPSRLYTMDIQHAWRHIQSGLELDQVPYMNRQRPKPAPPITPGNTARPASVGGVSQLSQQLLSVGIKDIKVKLVTPGEALQREPWLSSLDESRLYLVCTIHYGDVEMDSQKSYVIPVKKSETDDKYGTKTFQFIYPKQKFVFLDVDLSKYDIEREMGGFPYAVIRAEYRKPDGDPDVAGADTIVTLGATARITLYRDNPLGGQWQLKIGSDTYPIYATLPESSSTGSPRLTGGELIGPNSELGALLFDPHNEPLSGTTTPVGYTDPSPSPQPLRTPKASSPQPPGINDPFDLYIDGVDNIPDSATIIKVTGRLVKTGDIPSTRDVFALPDLSTPGRSPRFVYRQVINESGCRADPRMMVLLRVYTVDADTLELCVVGSCLIEVFDARQGLRIGRYKRALHTGMPDLKNGIEPITQDSLNDHPRIPGCCLYFRIAAHSDVPKSAKELTSPNYHFLDTPMNTSEKRVIESYANDAMFPVTEKLMVHKLMALEDRTPEGDEDEWREQRLDNKKQLPPNVPAGNLDLNRLVQYRIARGISVELVAGYGLPEDEYIQCLGRLIPGKSSKNFPTTVEGWGGKEKFISKTHDMDSLQTAPRWKDGPNELHPYADPYSVIILQVFRLDAVYVHSKNHQTPGHVKARATGEKLTLGTRQMIAWTVLPLFDKSYVLNGVHHLPLYKGEVPDDILELMEEDLPENIFQSNRDLRRDRMPGSALVVNLWDNHFSPSHVPATMQKFDFLLSTKEEYEESESKQTGPAISQFVLDALPPKEKKKGTNSKIYSTESVFFQSAMSDTFQNLMKNYLIAAGYGALDEK